MTDVLIRYLYLVLVLFALIGCSSSNDEIESKAITTIVKSNGILRSVNVNIIEAIKYQKRKDPVRASVAYQQSKIIYDLIFEFDLSIESYVKENDKEVRLITYEQLVEDYKETMNSLLRIKSEILKERDSKYQSYDQGKLSLVNKDIVYENDRSNEALNIKLMQKEVYINSYLLLDYLNHSIPSH